MKVFGLTGISKRVIDELVEHGVKTIELRSSQNVLAASRAKVGDLVFLTPHSIEDLVPGAEGVLARIMEKHVGLRRIGVFSQEEPEEREVLVARLKLSLVNICRASKYEATGEFREVRFYFSASAFECW
jgi:hypothetical protein